MTTVNLNLIPVDETQLVLAAGDDTQLVLSAGDETQIVLSSVAISNGLMMTDGSNSALALGSAGTPSLKFAGDANTGIFSPGADQLSVTTGGTERLRIDSAGQIEAVSLGSAAAPTFSFTGDPNTGIYSPGADQLAISTAGTGRLFVASGGNVGIGTTSPAYALDVQAGDARFKRSASDDAAIYFGSTTNNYIFGSNTGNLFVFATNGSERARITSAGNVGIGTSSPGQILDVSSSINADAAIRITNANAGAGAISEFLASNGTASAWYGIGGTNYTGYGQIRANGAAIYTSSAAGIGLSADNASGYISFGTGSGAPERLRITSAGLVGIGTSNPGTLLDTRGFASYRGNAYAIASFCGNNTLAPLNIVQSTNGTAPGISAGQNSSGAFQPLVLLTSEVVRQTISTVGTTTLNCNSATSPLQVQINSSEVARIDSSGRLGIGTTSPAVPLDVVGQIRSVDGTVDTRLQPLSGSNAAIAGTWSNHAYVLYTNNTERLRITSAGNVGIGTASPGGRLQINIQDGFLFDVGAGAYTYMRFGSQATAEGVAELAFDRSAGAVALKTGNTGSTLNTRLSIDAAGATIINNQSGTERARIDSSGRLLVGTSTNTGGSLFQVNDNRIRIATAKTPASATDTGSAGEICWDANYIYVCTATNTWKRTAIATW